MTRHHQGFVVAVLMGVSVGCSEQQLVPRDSRPSSSNDSEEDPDVLCDLPQADLALEVCDGQDNDGDGLVDEGFGDLDGDGTADCVDGACEVSGELEGEDLGETHSCELELTPPVEPWALERVWESTYELGGCMQGTVIFDADGDDVSDVVCSSGQEIVAHSGVDGQILYALPCGDYFTDLAAADADGDGRWELYSVCVNDAHQPHAVSWDADGVERWRRPLELANFFWTHMLSVEIADLEADGEPELITNLQIIDAATGGGGPALLADSLDECVHQRGLAIGQLDGHGPLEIVSGHRAWRSDTSPLWTAGPASWLGGQQVPVLAAPLGDDSPMVFMCSGDDSCLVVDANGVEQASITLDLPGHPGGACAADIDGDGEMEFVQVSYSEVLAFELDGSLAWSVENHDPGGMTGCTTFDFDLDGAKEVVHSNDEAIRILDGATGATLWEDTDWVSNTVLDVPRVADLDGDGSVELIVPNSGGPGWGYPAVRVYRNANRDWPPGSRIWPSATWSGTSHYADGTIPRVPAMPWATTRVWRGQPETFVTGSDLHAEVMDHCVSSCGEDGMVQVVVRLVNGGPEEVRAPVPVSVYTLASDGSRTLLETVTFEEYLLVGHASAGITLSFNTGQVQPQLLLVAGDDGTGEIAVDDCDPSDNETTWVLGECSS